MKFRPCLDLYDGKACLMEGYSTHNPSPKLSFISKNKPEFYAELYHENGLQDGHIFMFGPGNQEVCSGILAKYPSTFRVGGGITLNNAQFWLAGGAKAVIINIPFDLAGSIDWSKLAQFKSLLGANNIVLAVNANTTAGGICLHEEDWQNVTQTILELDLLKELAAYCHAFIIHAVSYTGFRHGVDLDLISLAAKAETHPVVYAGGVRTNEDLAKIKKLGLGKIDFTVGHGLDIFGGEHLKFVDLSRLYHSI